MHIQNNQIFLLVAAAARLSAAIPILPTTTALVHHIGVDLLNAPSFSTNNELARGIFKELVPTTNESPGTVPSNIKSRRKVDVVTREVCPPKDQTQRGRRDIQYKLRPTGTGSEEILRRSVGSITPSTVITLDDTPAPNPRVNPDLDIHGNQKVSNRESINPIHPRAGLSSVEDSDADNHPKLNKFGRFMFDLRRWASYWYRTLTSNTKPPQFDKDGLVLDISKLSPEELELLTAIGQEEFKALKGDAKAFEAEKVEVHPRQTTTTRNEPRGWNEFWNKVAKGFDRVFAESYVSVNSTVSGKTLIAVREIRTSSDLRERDSISTSTSATTNDTSQVINTVSLIVPVREKTVWEKMKSWFSKVFKGSPPPDKPREYTDPSPVLVKMTMGDLYTLVSEGHVLEVSEAENAEAY